MSRRARASSPIPCRRASGPRRRTKHAPCCALPRWPTPGSSSHIDGGSIMLLMIDNYDSFTYNLVQYFGELKQEVVVFRNDQVSLEEVEALAPAQIVISPGPCTPNEAG